MMIKNRWFALTLSLLSVLTPSTVFAQHGADRHHPDSVQRRQGPVPHQGPAYDTTSEAAFKGTVAHVKTGRSGLYWLSRIHTLGMGHSGVQETQLLLKTDTVMVEIHLGPTAFLTERKVEIRKGDTLDVTGSRIMIGESQVVLAREIRKGDNAWTLRDSTGQPLWSSSRSEARGFWTTKRVLVAIAVVKVVALATVLRH
jgi:hypothetical protein